MLHVPISAQSTFLFLVHIIILLTYLLLNRIYCSSKPHCSFVNNVKKIKFVPFGHCQNNSSHRAPELYNDTRFSHRALTTLSSSANKDPAHRTTHWVPVTPWASLSPPPSPVKFSPDNNNHHNCAHLSRAPTCPLIKYCFHI